MGSVRSTSTTRPPNRWATRASCGRIIADLGGVAVTVPDNAPFPHTQDATVMLEEALRTEARAEAAYREALPLFEHFSAWHHSLRHIMHDEERAQLEIRRWLKQA
jgi:bacterioferritin (cytochrome b1)